MTLKRKNEIKLRLTDKELEQLNEDVKKTGYSREAYIRSMLIKYRVPKPMPPESFNNTIYYLRKIGNNINQLAIIANKTGNIDTKKYKYEYEELNKIILELRKIVSGI
ncbi:plasmid mobilization protein [Holdemanella biformis]|jgi:hypothetical protein|uniref:plasmid mobilization protein n=1 Tax=Holdemanella biformis TaxID=1735 RepID=UPI0022E57260|nr:plasmid mobilization relaxosome protein MobC [Holdemanella biformis]